MWSPWYVLFKSFSLAMSERSEASTEMKTLFKTQDAKKHDIRTMASHTNLFGHNGNPPAKNTPKPRAADRSIKYKIPSYTKTP